MHANIIITNDSGHAVSRNAGRVQPKLSKDSVALSDPASRQAQAFHKRANNM